MKRPLLVAVFLILPGLPAWSQSLYSVDFFADAGLSTCELSVVPGAFVDVHLRLGGPGESIGVSFHAPRPGCMGNAVHVGDIWAGGTWGTIGGTTQTGITVLFDCTALPRYLGSIRYYAFTVPESCCEYSASIHPIFQSVIVTDCQFIDYYDTAAGRKVVMNANDTCRCSQPVAVRVGTWGFIKALYR